MNFWTIAGGLAVAAAVVFFILWRRSLTSTADAERAAARSERTAHEIRLTAAQNAAYLAALQLAQTEAVLLISPTGAVLSCSAAR